MERKRVISKPFKPIPLEVEAIGKKLLDAAYAVHSALGTGLLESVYQACTAYEAEKLGLRIETQVAVPVKYQTVSLGVSLCPLWLKLFLI